MSKQESNMKNYKILLSLLIAGSVLSCKKAEKDAETQEAVVEQSTVQVPQFNPDSAFTYVAKQVAFGPRVPGTKAQTQCAQWLSAKLKGLGWEVYEQRFDAKLYSGKVVPGINIVASYKPEAEKRILLASHWDSRPISDQDESVKDQAIDGANDGASGVGVLLEVARNLVQDSVNVGVDIVFFDVEDWGAPDTFEGKVDLEYGGYCLGSDYWSKNPHKKPYTAFYGILLDMVGAANAQFFHEQYSSTVAPSILAKVWDTASRLGYGNLFINSAGGAITDDHVPVIKNLGIPMIDIIDYRMKGAGTGDFFPHWHTTSDKLENIDKNTLKAVGQTLLHVIYHE